MTTSFITVQGCPSPDHNDSLQNPLYIDTHYLRVTDIAGFCKGKRSRRIRIRISREEYNREQQQNPNNPDLSNINETPARYVDTTIVTFENREKPLWVRETIESFKARVDALEHPTPVEPVVVKLGTATGTSNSQTLLTTLTESMDGYETLVLTGRAGSSAITALSRDSDSSFEIPVANIPINSDLTTGEKYTFVVPGAGNISVGRSTNGIVLYLLADDNAKALSFLIQGK